MVQRQNDIIEQMIRRHPVVGHDILKRDQSDRQDQQERREGSESDKTDGKDNDTF